MAETENAGTEIDRYVEGLASPFREAITHLRQTIRAAAPEAREIITYSMPGIGLYGPLVSYSAFKKHCSLFPMGNSVFVGMEEAIAPWRTSKGTLQFAPDALPPDELITRIVQARVRENTEKQELRKAKRRKS